MRGRFPRQVRETAGPILFEARLAPANPAQFPYPPDPPRQASIMPPRVGTRWEVDRFVLSAINNGPIVSAYFEIQLMLNSIDTSLISEQVSLPESGKTLSFPIEWYGSLRLGASDTLILTAYIINLTGAPNLIGDALLYLNLYGTRYREGEE